MEKKNTLRDNELQALARAYSYAAASTPLLDHYAYRVPEDQLSLSPTPPCLNDQQLAIYTAAVNKCLDTYEELAQRTPDYPTPIGPVTTKLANEYMFVAQFS